jgi:hypothetical protein
MLSNLGSHHDHVPFTNGNFVGLYCSSEHFKESLERRKHARELKRSTQSFFFFLELPDEEIAHYNLAGDTKKVRDTSVSVTTPIRSGLTTLSFNFGEKWGKSRDKSRNGNLVWSSPEPSQLPCLKELLIRNANCSGFSMRACADLALERLAFVSCFVGLTAPKFDFPRSCALCETLRSLTLSESGLRDFPDVSLFQNLEVLCLDRNLIREIPCDIGAPMLTLKKLDLSENALHLLSAAVLVLEALGCDVSLKGNADLSKSTAKLSSGGAAASSDDEGDDEGRHAVPSLKSLSGRRVFDAVDYGDHPDAKIIEELVVEAMGGPTPWYRMCFWCEKSRAKQEKVLVRRVTYAISTCADCLKNGPQKSKSFGEKKKAGKAPVALAVDRKTALAYAKEMAEKQGFK